MNPKKSFDMNEEILTKMTQSIIANQVALNFNEEIRHTPYYKKEFKKYYNLFERLLLKAEKKEFDLVYNSAENETIELHKHQSDMIVEISSLGIEHFKNVCEIVKAYKKDPEKMNKIVNKINE